VSSRNFFSELKRRNVYKVAVAYAVGSWLLIQIATQVFPFFEIPNWAVRLVVLLLIAGFPVTLVFSWAFEITPEGIKRESEIEPDKSITHHTGRKIVAITVMLAVIAAGLLAFQLVRQRHPVPSKDMENAPAPEKSIAVLPFENLSDDKSNGYFAEGIQDEILTRLAKIADLKVISRTSTLQFASAPASLRDIGKQLGVANILEGSVQKIANAVHVNVQLIRATTDQHLWAESYNRTLDDVFAVEGEVATTIADQLNIKLSGAEQKAVAEKPTDNTAAHDAYIRGRAIVAEGLSPENAAPVATEFEQAVKLDPKFAFAWAQLASVRSYAYFNGLGSAAAVKDAVEHAVALKPDSGEAWLAQAVYRYRVLRQFPSALEAYQNAQKRLPNDADVLENMAHLERRLGQKQAAENHYRAAAKLDPQNGDVLSSLAEFLASEGRFHESDEVVEQWLKISTDNEEALFQKAFNRTAQGRLVESAAVLNQIDRNSPALDIAVLRLRQLLFERKLEEAIALVKAGQPPAWANDPRTQTTLGQIEQLAGHEQEARETFTRALAGMKGRDGNIPVDTRLLRSFAMVAYAGLGQKEEAFAQAQQALAAYDNDALARPAVQLDLARIQLQFGDKEGALNTLAQIPPGADEGIRVDLRLSPFWDPLRNDSRFQRACHEPNQ
jgi:TolB-like protein/tetratricopeptide (TPR) repeat protein